MRLLLFSGGLDSTCLALMEQPDILLTIDYGQVCSKGEIRASKHLATLLSLRHETIRVPMLKLGSGVLAGASRSESEYPTEHWPYRNQMLITLAAMRYQREDLDRIIIGTVKSDNIHSDGTAEFIDAMGKTLAAQNPNLKLEAPALNMTTEGLVQASRISLDLIRWTFSCHQAEVACGLCSGCTKTLQIISQLESTS